ncbi:MAG: prolipoprotein diacylglyceryl transferase [Hyphomicrobiales bacterium]
MSPFVIPFPTIDPVLFEVGPFAIRWYALSYVAGILFAWIYMKRVVANTSLWAGEPPITPLQIDDLLFWSTLGVILGGRIGYIVAYGGEGRFSNPLDMLAIWRGGMSFHGGFLGVVLAVAVYCRVKGLRFLPIIDAVATGVPIGLFFGRIANFINGELFGRKTDVPWAMVFPHGGPAPRHPSQLYEAALEGLVLFVALRICTHRLFKLKQAGFISGVFASGYGAARVAVEFFRKPDEQIGFLAGGATMGMMLSVPMILIGVWLMVRARTAQP